MWIVFVSVDDGIPGLIECFTEEEKQDAMELYAAIRAAYVGKLPSPVIGDKASEGVSNANVSLLHTVKINQELADIIEHKDTIYNSMPIDHKPFHFNIGIRDNTGLQETKRTQKLNGSVNQPYISYRYNSAKPRKELSSFGFDKTLSEFAYMQKRVQGGYGLDEMPEIPEVVINEEETSYLTFQHHSFEDKDPLPNTDRIRTVTKKAWHID